MLEKARERARAKKREVNAGSIQAGAQVCLRSCPMYHHGALAFTIKGSQPKVGQLMDAAWNLTDTCRFRIKHTSLEREMSEGVKKQCLEEVGGGGGGGGVKSELKPEVKFEVKGDMGPPPSPASTSSGEMIVVSSPAAHSE